MWTTAYAMPARARDGVRVLRLRPSPEVLRLLKVPTALHEGGGAIVETRDAVELGDRVDIEFEAPGHSTVIASGVVRRVVDGIGTAPRSVHVQIAKSHAHRVRRMIELAAALAGSSSSSSPDAVRTLRLRANPQLLDVLSTSRAPDEGGSLVVAWRGAKDSGQRTQVELSFGPMADEIVLAATVQEVRHDNQRSVPTARLSIAAAHRHRVRYVVEVLEGLREANARAHRRVDVRIPGTWWLGAAAQPQVFEELSRAGTFVHTLRPPGIGSEIPLQFESPHVGQVRIPAEVMWISRDPRRSGFGAKFRVRKRSVADRIVDLMEHEASPRLAWR